MLTRSYPSDVIRINDYSGYELDVADEQGTRFLQIFTSDRGIDNKLLKFKPSQINDYVKEYGLPVFKRHGQPARQAFELINNGGIVNAMRITADDATYANVVLVAKTKVEKNVPKKNAQGQPLYITVDGLEVTEAVGNTAIIRDVVKVKIETQQLTSLKDLDTVEGVVMGNIYSAEVDESGYLTFPLFAIASSGRGSYGNNMHYRMTANILGDKERDHRSYSLQAFYNEGTLKQEGESLTVSLTDESNYRGLTEYIETVVSETAKGYKLFMIEDVYDEFVAEVKKTIPDMTEAELEPLFGRTRKGTAMYQLEIEEGSVDLSSLEGIKLNGGSDGAFDITNPGREDAINARLIEAYNGLIDDSINNTVSFPVDVVLDANLEASVKKAMVSLSLRRNDTVCIVDAGIQRNGTSALAWRERDFNYDNFRIMLYTESGMEYDELTKKNILVTETYKLAKKIPRHDLDKGNHIPLAGLNHGIASKYVQGTQRPVINDPDMQDLLNDNRINFSDTHKDTRYYNVENTSQYKYSDLSFYHNVRVLMDLKRAIEDFARYKRYEFSDLGNIGKFISEANDALVPEFVSKEKVQSFAINAYQSERDKQQKIVRWGLDIKCREFILYNIIDLNIR